MLLRNESRFSGFSVLQQLNKTSACEARSTGVLQVSATNKNSKQYTHEKNDFPQKVKFLLKKSFTDENRTRLWFVRVQRANHYATRPLEQQMLKRLLSNNACPQRAQ